MDQEQREAYEAAMAKVREVRVLLGEASVLFRAAKASKYIRDNVDGALLYLDYTVEQD